MKKKVYHVSSPFEIPHTNDYNYGTAIIKELSQNNDLAVEYLKVNTAINVYTSCVLKRLTPLKHLNQGVKSLGDKKDFSDKFKVWKDDETRKEIIKQIMDYIIKDSEAFNYFPILNLQLRPPVTGFAFVPEDIIIFKNSGIQVNVTCHEYQLNGIDRVYYQAVLHKYFREANTVSFFNLSDFTNASKFDSNLIFLISYMPCIADLLFFYQVSVNSKSIQMPILSSAKLTVTPRQSYMTLHRINIFKISKRWDSVCDIGLQKDNKLIYISTFGCKNGYYFYECELLVNDLEEVYIVQDTKTDILEENLLKVISKFFEIERKIDNN